MEIQYNIAIVGLGRVGAQFLALLLQLRPQGLQVVCVAQRSENLGTAMARAAGLHLGTLDDIVDKGPTLDLVFDLTGDPAVRRELLARLERGGNRHTAVVPDALARVWWAYLTRAVMPQREHRCVPTAEQRLPGPRRFLETIDGSGLPDHGVCCHAAARGRPRCRCLRRSTGPGRQLGALRQGRG